MSAPTTPRPSGGSTKGRTALTGTQMQLVIAAAHRALTDCDIEIGPSKVARIVRKFSKHLARSGMTFGVFLENKANQRWMPGDPVMARTLTYLDPTGQIACNHVMRERGW